MDMQLQELLDKIKAEGVEAAKKEAAAIIADAEGRSKKLLAEAEAEAQAALKKAEAEIARREESAKASLAQISRDALLTFRDGLDAVLAAATKVEVGASYGPETLPEAIAAAVRGLSAGKSEDLAVLLPPDLLAKVEARTSSLLAAELKKGLVIKAGPGLTSGFRIAEKNGAAYYDFSAEVVAEIFSARLSAHLAQILTNAAKGL